MEQTYVETGATVMAVATPAEEVTRQEQLSVSEREHDLMAPGHLYNPRTGTGIEWLPPGPGTGEPGRVRLWSRRWGEQPTVLAEAEHHMGSPWEYWYNLEFANSFPQVTHWWFGDAWTGMVRIWQPEGVGRDPESGAPMLSGWMRFGSAETPTKWPVDAPIDPMDDIDGSLGPALPWTIVLTHPLRVSTPLPPMHTNMANLPLQLLLGETVLDILATLATFATVAERGSHSKGSTSVSGTDRGAAWRKDVALTSLVRQDDLYRAFPASFGPWRLDALPDLTPREALCRVQGLEPAALPR